MDELDNQLTHFSLKRLKPDGQLIHYQLKRMIND